MGPGCCGRRPAVPGDGRMSTASRARRFRDVPAALIFVGPAAAGFLTFYLWPALRGLYLSFTDFSLLSAPEFVGLDNYERLIGDHLFWNALVVTLEYVVINIAVQTVFAVLLAVLMHRLTTSMTIRSIVLLPYLIANVIAALVWYSMLDYQTGVVNQ